MVTLKKVWDFLSELAENNNKPWFDAHKDLYKEALSDAQLFAEQLIVGLSKFDKDVAGLAVKECTYRIFTEIYVFRWIKHLTKRIGVCMCVRKEKRVEMRAIMCILNQSRNVCWFQDYICRRHLRSKVFVKKFYAMEKDLMPPYVLVKDLSWIGVLR